MAKYFSIASSSMAVSELRLKGKDRSSNVSRNLPYYMEYYGNYATKINSSETERYAVKHYFISRRLEITWMMSNFCCNAFGMQLTSFEDLDELNYFVKNTAGKNLELLDDCVFLQFEKVADNSSEIRCPSFCRPIKMEADFKYDDCVASQDRGFMWIYEELDASEALEYLPGKTKAKTTFLNYLGVNLETAKKYYLSHNTHYLELHTAQTLCLIFNLTLARTETEKEMNAIKNLLKLIFLSQKYMLASNDRIYRRDDPKEDPTKERCRRISKEGENSIYFQQGDCYERLNGFICEFDPSNDLTFHLLKLIMKTSAGETKQLFMSTAQMKWNYAVLACKMHDMKILMSESREEESAMREALKDIDKKVNLTEYITQSEMGAFKIMPSFYIGATSIGKKYFYSINTGEMLDFPWESKTFKENSGQYTPHYDDADDEEKSCLIDYKLSLKKIAKREDKMTQ
ncbi:CLUMA_CG000750, isoform A [Clunio marinus]|uniref:CLUMA_CG000750, isoform A n=1 Tax=Clunio marinus TaxID=568069 RepID=A0A1J1HL16_9DIPT|nr:CLUMA_CG000750, isoform A [Clunio marinus]